MGFDGIAVSRVALVVAPAAMRGKSGSRFSRFAGRLQLLQMSGMGWAGELSFRRAQSDINMTDHQQLALNGLAVPRYLWQNHYSGTGTLISSALILWSWLMRGIRIKAVGRYKCRVRSCPLMIMYHKGPTLNTAHKEDLGATGLKENRLLILWLKITWGIKPYCRACTACAAIILTAWPSINRGCQGIRYQEHHG